MHLAVATILGMISVMKQLIDPFVGIGWRGVGAPASWHQGMEEGCMNPDHASHVPTSETPFRMHRK